MRLLGAPFVLVTALAALSLPMGCASLSRVDPSLFQQRSFALASVHARVSVDFQNMGSLAPMLYDNELGLDALEMELGENEVRLGEILGATLVPPGKVLMAKKAYDALPESLPPELWTQVNGMTAVDIDHPQTAAALGGVARALQVDAAVVVRHEWVVARDKLQMGDGVTVYDRCSILVVDTEGRRIWDDVVVVRTLVSALFAGSLGVGMNGGTWADEARQNARRTAKLALDELGARYARARAAAAVEATKARQASAAPAH